MAIHAFQRLLGLRRPWRFKIVPVVLGVVCYLPVVAFLAMDALGAAALPVSFRQLFALLNTPVMLFCIAIGPGGMIADRNSKSLSLYLASPLTRGTYLVSQAMALFVAICLVTIGPPLLYLAGIAAIDLYVLEYPLQFLRVLGKILLGGGLIAGFYTTVVMAVAAINKRAVAAAVVMFLTVGVLSGMVVAAVLNGASRYLVLADPGTLTHELVNRLFGPERILPEVNFYGVPMYLVALATAGWAAVAVAITAYRYRRLVVSR